jgi:hypothetical protein
MNYNRFLNPSSNVPSLYAFISPSVAAHKDNTTPLPHIQGCVRDSSRLGRYRILSPNLFFFYEPQW